MPDARVGRYGLPHQPADLSAFLALPHETFDGADGVADGGWLVD